MHRPLGKLSLRMPDRMEDIVSRNRDWANAQVRRKSMLMGKIGLVLISVALAGCDQHDSSSHATKSSATQPVVQSASLNPIFSDAIQCLRQCEGNQITDGGKTYTGPVPYRFSDYFSQPEGRELFLSALRELPPEWMPLGVLNDGEGNQLSMSGWITIVLRWKGREIYIFAQPGYVQGFPSRYPDGSIILAVDPATKEYAGILNYNSDLSGYRFFGNKEILPFLVAYQAATEAETEKANKISRTELPRPVQFPIASDRIADTGDRLRYLASLYRDNSSEITGAKSAYAAGDASRASTESHWFAASVSGGCSESISPATRIQQIRDAGFQASTKDENDIAGKLKSVEVSYDEGLTTHYTVYYKSKSDCEAAVDTANSVPDKYR